MFLLSLAAAAAAGLTHVPMTLERTLGQAAGAPVVCHAPGAFTVTGETYRSGGAWDGDRIRLSAAVCGWLALNLDGYYYLAATQGQAWAWHTLAHEAAHADGFDHGERTVGADCRGARTVGPLMRRLRQPAWFRHEIRREIARHHYCSRKEH